MDEGLQTSSFFDWVHYLLLSIQAEAPTPMDAQVVGQLRLLRMDVNFLKAFSVYHESWFYSADENIRERLALIITHLREMWPKELQIVSLAILPKPLMRSWIQDFHSVNFELEAKIQQSKRQVEAGCEILMHSSSMQYQSLSFFNIQKYLKNLGYNLEDFSSCRAEKIVPLKKQIDLLEGKIVFLVKSLGNVERYLDDGKEILQVLNFIGDYTNSAACLACLYWTKEDNEEIATEMNIVLFDMLHKFISYAYDLAPLYIPILKPYHSHHNDCETVESFVDFFFGHVATILKDDYLILRNRLIFLFTFLTDPPYENIEVENLIRTQIYALFQDDAYLLMPFDEMKQDFSGNQKLLSDFMVKTDITIAKIRQNICGFSGSWIKMEVEKMEYIYFVSVERELSWIEKHSQWVDSVRGQLKLYRTELRFLKGFLLCFTTWNDTDEDIKVRMASMITSLYRIWGKEDENGLLAHRLHAIRTGGIKNWHPLASEFEGKIKLSKLEIKEWWVNVFHLSFRCRHSTCQKIVKFVDYILDNLHDIDTLKVGEIMPFKKQIKTLEEKLVFLKNFSILAANCIDCKELEIFNMFVQVLVNDAACLTFIYWARDTNDEITYETNAMISHMLLKIKPSTPDVARLYFGTLMSIYVQRSDSFMFGQTVLNFVDIFLIDLMTPLKDEFQILHNDIVFLLTFLNDRPNENEAELICSQSDLLFWEGLFGLLPFDDIDGDFSMKKILLSDFMMKIESVNANIRKKYSKFPDLSLYNFPKVVSPGFLDFLIQNLRNLKEKMSSDHKYVPFAKNKITRIEEELVSLGPFSIIYSTFKVNRTRHG